MLSLRRRSLSMLGCHIRPGGDLRWHRIFQQLLSLGKAYLGWEGNELVNFCYELCRRQHHWETSPCRRVSWDDLFPSWVWRHGYAQLREDVVIDEDRGF